MARESKDQGARFCPACGSSQVRRRTVLRGKKRPQVYDEIVCFDCRVVFILRRVQLQRERELFPCAICGGPTCLASGYKNNRCKACAHAQAAINTQQRETDRIRREERKAAEQKWLNAGLKAVRLPKSKLQRSDTNNELVKQRRQLRKVLYGNETSN